MLIDLLAQGERVQGVVLLGEAVRHSGQDLSGEQPLVGGLSTVEGPVEAGAVPDLADELQTGLEEVGVQAQALVDGIKGGDRRRGFVPVVADEAADDRPVFLLDVGLVVLAIRTAAGEGDVLLAAVAQELVVDEGVVIIRVQAAKRDWEAVADLLEGGEDGALAAVRDGAALAPPRGDIDRAQRVRELAGGGQAAVRDEVNFQEAGPDVIPLGEGADGNLAEEQRSRASSWTDRAAGAIAGRERGRDRSSPG